jgi:hypothetical protein
MAKQKEPKPIIKRKTLVLLGLAVLIIIFVLLVLSAQGTFYVPGVNGNTCVADSGYLCLNPVYFHSTGNILVTIGQNTGTSWLTANFVFVPKGTLMINGKPSISFTSTPANTTYSTTGIGFITGQTTQTIHLPVTGAVSMGTPAIGSIWVEYTTMNNSTPQYVQMATINIKAS